MAMFRYAVHFKHGFDDEAGIKMEITVERSVDPGAAAFITHVLVAQAKDKASSVGISLEGFRPVYVMHKNHLVNMIA